MAISVHIVVIILACTACLHHGLYVLHLLISFFLTRMACMPCVLYVLLM